ncbi:hypothetical protein WDU94_006433 [Cyamophila willieti]
MLHSLSKSLADNELFKERDRVEYLIKQLLSETNSVKELNETESAILFKMRLETILYIVITDKPEDSLINHLIRLKVLGEILLDSKASVGTIRAYLEELQTFVKDQENLTNLKEASDSILKRMLSNLNLDSSYARRPLFTKDLTKVFNLFGLGTINVRDTDESSNEQLGNDFSNEAHTGNTDQAWYTIPSTCTSTTNVNIPTPHETADGANLDSTNTVVEIDISDDETVEIISPIHNHGKSYNDFSCISLINTSDLSNNSAIKNATDSSDPGNVKPYTKKTIRRPPPLIRIGSNHPAVANLSPNVAIPSPRNDSATASPSPVHHKSHNVATTSFGDHAYSVASITPVKAPLLAIHTGSSPNNEPGFATVSPCKNSTFIVSGNDHTLTSNAAFIEPANDRSLTSNTKEDDNPFNPLILDVHSEDEEDQTDIQPLELDVNTGNYDFNPVISSVCSLSENLIEKNLETDSLSTFPAVEKPTGNGNSPNYTNKSLTSLSKRITKIFNLGLTEQHTTLVITNEGVKTVPSHSLKKGRIQKLRESQVEIEAYENKCSSQFSSLQTESQLLFVGTVQPTTTIVKAYLEKLSKFMVENPKEVVGFQKSYGECLISEMLSSLDSLGISGTVDFETATTVKSDLRAFFTNDFDDHAFTYFEASMGFSLPMCIICLEMREKKKLFLKFLNHFVVDHVETFPQGKKSEYYDSIETTLDKMKRTFRYMRTFGNCLMSFNIQKLIKDNKERALKDEQDKLERIKSKIERALKAEQDKLERIKNKKRRGRPKKSEQVNNIETPNKDKDFGSTDQHMTRVITNEGCKTDIQKLIKEKKDQPLKAEQDKLERTKSKKGRSSPKKSEHVENIETPNKEKDFGSTDQHMTRVITNEGCTTDIQKLIKEKKERALKAEQDKLERTTSTKARSSPKKSEHVENIETPNKEKDFGSTDQHMTRVITNEGCRTVPSYALKKVSSQEFQETVKTSEEQGPKDKNDSAKEDKTNEFPNKPQSSEKIENKKGRRFTKENIVQAQERFKQVRLKAREELIKMGRKVNRYVRKRPQKQEKTHESIKVTVIAASNKKKKNKKKQPYKSKTDSLDNESKNKNETSSELNNKENNSEVHNEAEIVSEKHEVRMVTLDKEAVSNNSASISVPIKEKVPDEETEKHEVRMAGLNKETINNNSILCDTNNSSSINVPTKQLVPDEVESINFPVKEECNSSEKNINNSDNDEIVVKKEYNILQKTVNADDGSQCSLKIYEEIDLISVHDSDADTPDELDSEFDEFVDRIDDDPITTGEEEDEVSELDHSKSQEMEQIHVQSIKDEVVDRIIEQKDSEKRTSRKRKVRKKKKINKDTSDEESDEDTSTAKKKKSNAEEKRDKEVEKRILAILAAARKEMDLEEERQREIEELENIQKPSKTYENKKKTEAIVGTINDDYSVRIPIKSYEKNPQKAIKTYSKKEPVSNILYSAYVSMIRMVTLDKETVSKNEICDINNSSSINVPTKQQVKAEVESIKLFEYFENEFNETISRTEVGLDVKSKSQGDIDLCTDHNDNVNVITLETEPLFTSETYGTFSKEFHPNLTTFLILLLNTIFLTVKSSKLLKEKL